MIQNDPGILGVLGPPWCDQGVDRWRYIFFFPLLAFEIAFGPWFEGTVMRTMGVQYGGGGGALRLPVKDAL